MGPDELYEKGFEYRCNGAYGVARSFLEQALAADPNHVKAKWQLALILGFEGDFEGSLEELKRLCVQNPESEEVRNDLAMTYMMLGYQDEACAEFHILLRQNPDHENAKRQSAYC